MDRILTAETQKRMTLRKQELDAFLERLFQTHALPGMAVCIRGPGGATYEKYLGKRSLSKNQPVTPDTIFGIASLSKSFVGCALSLLEAEGRVRLSEPVSRYLPHFRVPGIPQDMVEIHHLLTHTSGLPPMQPLEWSIAMNSRGDDSEWARAMREQAPNKMETIDEVLSYIAAGDYGRPAYTTLGFPGEYMSYSNEGYAILSYVVDRVADMPLEDFLQERIFKPLGMSRTVLDLDGSEARAIAGGDITSLFEQDGDHLAEDDYFSVLPPFRGAACMKSTARDLTKYYKMLGDGGLFEGEQIIPRKAVDIMVGKAFPLQKAYTYCYGLKKRLFCGRTIGEHTGGLHGTSCSGGFIEGPDLGFMRSQGSFSITVLTNVGNADTEPFRSACYNFILGLPLDTDHVEFVPASRPFAEPEQLTGDFVSQEGLPQHALVRVEDGHLTIRYQGEEVLAEYCGGNRFLCRTAKEPHKRVELMRFFVHRGRAQAVQCGSRVYQRTEENQ